MIIFLYGRDNYRLKQSLDKIVEEYKNKHPIGASFSFDLAEHGEAAKFEDSLKSISFFDEKKLLIIKNPFDSTKQLVETVKKFDLNNDKQTIAIFIETQDESELAKKDRGLWSVLTAKPNLVKTFETLEGKKLENWVVREAVALGCSIEQPAIKKLTSLTTVAGEKKQKTADSWRLHLELEKLANYHNGYKGHPCMCKDAPCISVGDVELLVTPAEDLNIFELVDAVASRARLRATRLLHKNLESGQDPFYIFSMFVYQFRNLLRVKSLTENAVPYQTIIQKTGLNPFVVKKTYDQSKKYDFIELKKTFSTLASLDWEAKSGQKDLADGLYQFTFSL